MVLALAVTRHTSYAAGDCAGLCLPLERRGGVDNASLGGRRRDQSSPRDFGVAGASGREHFRLRRRDKTSPCSVGVAGVSGGHGALPSCTLSRSLGSACSSSRLVSSGRGAGAVGAESASASVEARKCSDLSFSSLFVRCMSPSQRVAHVSDSVTRLLTTATRDMHGSMNSCGSMHGAVMHDNSLGMHVNSCGALGHRNSCNLHAAEVRGGTKAPSMSTRLGVRCLAVEKLASPQQAPGSLHGEVWASILQNQGPKIFGRIIRNMLGWSRLERTGRSGVWLFRGAFQGKNLFFFP